MGFTETVGGDPFSAANSREIALLLVFGPEENQRERTDVRVRAVGGRERGIASDALGNDLAAGHVQLEPAVLLGNADSQQTEVAGLLHELAGEAGLLRLELLDPGEDFFGHEAVGRGFDLALFFGEVFRGEGGLGGNVFEKKTAAGRGCARYGNGLGGGHGREAAVLLSARS